MLLDRIEGDPVWSLVSRCGWLAVESAFPKAGWRDRAEGSLGLPSPGSCIGIHDVLYEVRDIHVTARGATYVLAPWESCHPVRGIHRHTPETHRADGAAWRQADRDARLIYPALWSLSPLVGALPASWQRRIGDRYGIQPTTLTAISAAAELVTAGLLLARAASSLEMGMAMLLAPFVAEAIVRIRTALVAGDPMASLPVWVASLVIDAVRHDLRRLGRRREGRHDALLASRRAALARRLDLQQPRADGGLVVKSYTPKPWTDGPAVVASGRYFCLDGTSEEVVGGERLYVYQLRPAEACDVLRGVVAYRPDEALRNLEEAAERDRRDRLAMMAPFIGALPAAWQERLADRGHDPLRGVRQSAALLGSAGIAAILFGAGGGAWPIAGLALLAESAWRAMGTRQGIVRGSLLTLPLALLRRR